MDKQNIQDVKWLHKKFVYSITGRTCKVINELGNRFLEFVYDRVFIIVLSDAGFFIQAQRLVKGHFHRDIGNNFCSDLFVKEEEVRSHCPGASSPGYQLPECRWH